MLSSPNPQISSSIHPTALPLTSSIFFTSSTSATSPSTTQSLPLFSTPSKHRPHTNPCNSIPFTHLRTTLITPRGGGRHPQPLNPMSANVDAASSISPLFATLAENTRGGVSPLSPLLCATSAFSAPLRYLSPFLSRWPLATPPLRLHGPAALRPYLITSLSHYILTSLLLPPMKRFLPLWRHTPCKQYPVAAPLRSRKASPITEEKSA